MKTLRCALGVLGLALLLPIIAHAQSTGAIAGVARDTTEGALPGVTVEVASPGLIEGVRTAITDGSGNYRVIDLPPATYSVTFTLPGFSTVIREGVELSAGFTANVTVEMQVGGVEETITVTGASPVVDIQNVRSQNVLTEEVLDALPTVQTMHGFANLTLGMTALRGKTPSADVGGSKGEQTSSALSIHGMRGTDQRWSFDSMSMNATYSNGSRRIYYPNTVAVQEVVLATAASDPQIETGGVVLNMVPKEGGNQFSVYFNGVISDDSLQSDNITDEIRSRGLTAAPGVKKMYDAGLGIGGPIVRDKVWFYSSNRKWVTQEFSPGTFSNKDTSVFTYEPDMSRPGFVDTPSWDIAGRVTWQVTDKHKIAGYGSIQKSCQCFLGLSASRSPGATAHARFGPMGVPQVTWTYPASNQLLFQAGVSYGRFLWNIDLPDENKFPGNPAVLELSTGFIFRNNGYGLSLAGLGGPNDVSPLSQRFSISYVTGSHSFTAGNIWIEGDQSSSHRVEQGLWFHLRGGVPNAIRQWASPVSYKNNSRNIGLFASDQWTIDRLTLNLGMRFDYFKGWVPAGERPPSIFVAGFSYDKVDNVPNYKDFSPRLGAAYDLFGDGKTAIKGSFGRYVISLGVGIANSNNPALTIVQNTTRSWSDDGNFVPDCDLSSPVANGECGALSNSQFGQTSRNTFFDQDLLEGWGTREYSWQGSLSVQQELRPGVGLEVGYFFTSYTQPNFQVTDNELVTPADYDPYCVTAPTDTRLPGGGGNELCGLFDLNPAKFGQFRGLITGVGNFGDRTERFNGLDIALNARFGDGGFVRGGVSFGQKVIDSCYLVDSPQQARDGFCRESPPWSAGTQVKFNGAYPLPWDIQTAFNVQNIAGGPLEAVWAAPNSAIAPSLGRDLSAGARRTASVALIPPGTEYLDRMTQVDLRFSKTVPIAGGGRVKALFDVYNVFNSSTILGQVNSYGPAWQRPSTILGGRLFKFGAQVDW